MHLWSSAAHIPSGHSKVRPCWTKRNPVTIAVQFPFPASWLFRGESTFPPLSHQPACCTCPLPLHFSLQPSLGFRGRPPRARLRQLRNLASCYAQKLWNLKNTLCSPVCTCDACFIINSKSCVITQTKGCLLVFVGLGLVFFPDWLIPSSNNIYCKGQQTILLRYLLGVGDSSGGVCVSVTWWGAATKASTDPDIYRILPPLSFFRWPSRLFQRGGRKEREDAQDLVGRRRAFKMCNYEALAEEAKPPRSEGMAVRWQ